MGMFIVKKNMNDRFRLALIKLLTPENGECNGKKTRGKEKRGEKNALSGVVVERNRWSETDHIQSQHTVPLFTEGRLKGSNVKSLQHF